VVYNDDVYGCETWSLTLREEHKLNVFENKVLRRMFGPKRDEMVGDWRKLHKELFAKYNYYDQVKGERWAGRVALMVAKKNAYGISVGTSERNRPQGKPKRRRDKY
jgi:hypothetical protein